MIREEGIEQIWDGHLYRSSDLVRCDTGGCSGCSRCCEDMADTIVLDPMDIYELGLATGDSFDGLLAKSLIRMDVADGLILPFIGTVKGKPACLFLDAQGRCRIHSHRPGICRLFPLGRYYSEEGDFTYILQIHECTHPRSKVRVRKWLGIPDLPSYEHYIRSWHHFYREAAALSSHSDENVQKLISMSLLNHLYRQAWDYTAPFYLQFDQALPAARAAIGLAPES